MVTWTQGGPNFFGPFQSDPRVPIVHWRMGHSKAYKWSGLIHCSFKHKTPGTVFWNKKEFTQDIPTFFCLSWNTVVGTGNCFSTCSALYNLELKAKNCGLFLGVHKTKKTLSNIMINFWFAIIPANVVRQPDSIHTIYSYTYLWVNYT